MMGKKFSRTKESYKNGGGMPPKQKRWPTTTKNGRDVEVEMLRVRKSINRALQSSTINNNNNSREQVAKSHVYIMTARAPDVSAGVRKTSNSNQDIMVKVTTSVNISRAN